MVTVPVQILSLILCCWQSKAPWLSYPHQQNNLLTDHSQNNGRLFL